MNRNNLNRILLLVFIALSTFFAFKIRLENVGYIFAGFLILIVIMFIAHISLMIIASKSSKLYALIVIAQILYITNLLISVDVHDYGRGGGMSIVEFLYARGIEVEPPRWLFGSETAFYVSIALLIAFMLADLVILGILIKKNRSKRSIPPENLL
ncbi:MAG: hypothetical protein ACK4TA_21810 [Saprospiraceae bacterium]